MNSSKAFKHDMNFVLIDSDSYCVLFNLLLCISELPVNLVLDVLNNDFFVCSNQMYI